MDDFILRINSLSINFLHPFSCYTFSFNSVNRIHNKIDNYVHNERKVIEKDLLFHLMKQETTKG